MMGVGSLFTRAIKYDVTNTVTGEFQSFEILDRLPLAPQWASGAYHGAMAIPGVWRASVLLSDLLGGVPWHAYRERAGQPVEKLSAPLLDQPAPPETRMNTFSGLALDLFFHGNAIAIYVARNVEGYPTACVPVSAECVGIRRRQSDGQIEYEINGRKFESGDVLHIKGPAAPGALRGLGVLEVHFQTLEHSRELQRQASNVNKTGVPTGLLKMQNADATQEAANEAKASWNRAQRDRQIAVLNSATEFVPLSWNPTETQLIEARQFGLVEIANLFGVDPSWLGAAQASRVYSNIEQEAINLTKYSLGGHLARFEQALTLAFPRGTWVKANLDALLRSDTLTRYQAHAIGIEKGFLEVNEVRALEDRAPIVIVEKPSTSSEEES